jgi:hypothetical protein
MENVAYTRPFSQASKAAIDANSALSRNANAPATTPTALRDRPPETRNTPADEAASAERGGVSAELSAKRRLIAEIQSAMSNGFASLGLPLKLRVMVSAIIAAAHDQSKVSEGKSGQLIVTASYGTLARLLFQAGDGRTFMAKKAEARRLVSGLRAWQEKTKICLCTIRQGGRSRSEDGSVEYHNTEFELAFLDAIAKALLREPRPDQMRGAVRLELGTMMKLPPFDSRWCVKAPTPEEIQRRDRKAAITKALKACEKEIELGGDPLQYVEMLAREMVETARTTLAATSHREDVSAGLNAQNTEVDQQEGVLDSAHLCLELPSINQKEEVVISTIAPPVFLDVHTPDERNTGGAQASPHPIALLDGHDAVRMIDLVERAGVSVFEVTMKDDAGDRLAGFDAVDGQSFRARLPRYLKQNAECAESLIVRLRGGHLLQVDDAPIDVIVRLRPLSIVTFCTSPRSYQALLAFDSAEEMARVRVRLLAKLKPTGANAGGNGSMRWPGSHNCKPQHQRPDGSFPRVFLDSTFGRFASVGALDAADLLAPELPPEPEERRCTSQRRGASVFPSYAKCLVSKAGDRSRADASFLKICLLRGISEPEAVWELQRVSERVQQDERGGRKDYVARTLRFVEA